MSQLVFRTDNNDAMLRDPSLKCIHIHLGDGSLDSRSIAFGVGNDGERKHGRTTGKGT